MTDRPPSPSALERAQADTRVLAAFEAAYCGPYPALDALWWLDHPQQTTPDGTPSPAAQLALLRRQLYDRDGDQGRADEYRTTAAAWADACADASRAFDAALTVASATQVAPADPGNTPGLRPARRRWPVAMGAGVLVGLVIAAVVIAAIVPSPAPRPATQPLPTASGYSARFRDGSGGTPGHRASLLPPTVAGEVLAEGTIAKPGPLQAALNGGGAAVLIAIRCRGVGEVHIAVSDGTVIDFFCDGQATQTASRRTAHGLGRFRLTITSGGGIDWTMRVARPRSSPDAP